MINYKIVDIKKEKSVGILEKQTDIIIKKFPNKEKENAKNFCKNLNLGGGFDGFTPDFFMKKFQKV